MSLGPQTVTRLRPATVTDAYGNDVKGPVSAALVISGCSVQPVAAGEFTQDREAATFSLSIWMPGAPDVVATDRIAVGGQTYEISGAPEVWGFPPLDHTVVRVRKVEG